MRMSCDVSVVEIGLLETVMEDVDDPKVELRNMTNVRSALKPVWPFSFPVHKVGIICGRKFLTLRIRRRERVVVTDHFVPTREELAEVFVVISIDTVAEENDCAILDKLDER